MIYISFIVNDWWDWHFIMWIPHPGTWPSSDQGADGRRSLPCVTSLPSRVTCHVSRVCDITGVIQSRVRVVLWPMFALCGGDAGSVDIQPSPWYLDIYSFLLSVDITIYSLGSYNIHNNSLITTKHKEPGWHTSGYNIMKLTPTLFRWTYLLDIWSQLIINHDPTLWHIFHPPDNTMSLCKCVSV